uniref:Uncharacterized protein n=1 Tax=Vitis vinifera TaxID=29760 RepID=F6H8Z3_VITVI
MPSQMDHLLQKLSNYRVGKQSGTRVGESSNGAGSGRSRGVYIIGKSLPI